MRRLFEHNDEQFRKDLLSDYHISLKVSYTNVCVAILDTLRQKIVHLSEWVSGISTDDVQATRSIELLLGNAPWLLGEYKRTSILLQGTKYVLVPDVLYHEENKIDYLSFATGGQSNAKVFSSKCADSGMYSVFAVPKGLAEQLIKKYPGSHLECYDSHLIDALGNRNPEGQMLSAYLNVEDGQRCQVLVFKGKELLFLNSFSYSNSKDLLYYLLASLQSCDARPGDVNLRLSGSLERSSGLFEAIYKYVRNVNFIGRNPQLNYASFFDDIPSHRYYNLLNSLI